MVLVSDLLNKFLAKLFQFVAIHDVTPGFNQSVAFAALCVCVCVDV